MQALAEYGIRNFLDGVRRRRVLLIGVAGTIFSISVLLALFLPPVYRSQAIILIEQQAIPSDLVRSTVTSFADQRIQVISQRVMTSANLLEIIEKYDLFAEERQRVPREVVIEEMRGDIDRQMISADVVDPRSGRPTEATIAFSLSFDHRNPSVAQKVASELVSLFLNENIKSRTEAATETASFLSDEADKLRTEVADLETKLAAFKTENAGNRPELEQLIRDNLNRTELEIADVDRLMQAAGQQKLYLESDLAQTDPYSQVSASGVVSATARLRAVEAELVAAESSYGERHPDVLRLRKQAEALRVEADPAAARSLYEAQLADAEAQAQDLAERYAADHPDLGRAQRRVETLRARITALPEARERKADNPAYIGVKVRLDSARTDLASLRVQRQALQDKVEQLNKSLYALPDIEAKYLAMRRDYEAAVARYQEITAKQMEARLSQNLESERKGEKFTLIEPPFVPAEPAKPNRLAILVIGVLFSFVGGIGAVGMAESADTRIHGRRGVQQILTDPPLAMIPVIQGKADVCKVVRRRYSWIVAALLALVAGLTLIHFTFKPLDVLWFVIMRKLGL